MSCESIEVTTGSPGETAVLGAALARWLREGDVVLLHGDLGAGKTVLAKGIAQALGVDAVVASPSFALVNEYDAGLLSPIARLYHLDLYRLRDAADLESIGFADLVSPVDGVTLIEWPERALAELPDRYLLVEITSAGPDQRRIALTPVPADGSWGNRGDGLRERMASFRSIPPRGEDRHHVAG
ncbi:MAG: tRNA (adenosine(37)-N6)-threonylcarbamoyltransferase complex ATPase subunit type 1 TsaE [Thermomicrobiales bacterium]|nr:tRNA (adenosine(37)-N6)-threonylcarbamoyltransferase complex ATPase subunit type 1 TsaE [Thermomicrobiales bacterium]